MIYRANPEVGAILHIHAWVEGIDATEINYPCGTSELAESVAALVAAAPDPGAYGRRPAQPRDHGDRREPDGDPRPDRAEPASAGSDGLNLHGFCKQLREEPEASAHWSDAAPSLVPRSRRRPGGARRGFRIRGRSDDHDDDHHDVHDVDHVDDNDNDPHDHDDASAADLLAAGSLVSAHQLRRRGRGRDRGAGPQGSALGTPASSLGPSAYPTTAPIVRFLSSYATGSACKYRARHPRVGVALRRRRDGEDHLGDARAWSGQRLRDLRVAGGPPAGPCSTHRQLG